MKYSTKVAGLCKIISYDCILCHWGVRQKKITQIWMTLDNLLYVNSVPLSTSSSLITYIASRVKGIWWVFSLTSSLRQYTKVTVHDRCTSSTVLFYAIQNNVSWTVLEPYWDLTIMQTFPKWLEHWLPLKHSNRSMEATNATVWTQNARIENERI